MSGLTHPLLYSKYSAVPTGSNNAKFAPSKNELYELNLTIVNKLTTVREYKTILFIFILKLFIFIPKNAIEMINNPVRYLGIGPNNKR
tara:strand:+ start:276 stop:539 length:264 start_codon:yes stop_codon:yes gene_type:complete